MLAERFSVAFTPRIQRFDSFASHKNSGEMVSRGLVTAKILVQLQANLDDTRFEDILPGRYF